MTAAAPSTPIPGTYAVSTSRRIDAPAERVYAVFADYREGHPKILPSRYFTGLSVEEGGYGAGTRLVVEMRVGGRIRTLRGTVTEPEPGRRLVETYPADRTETAFLVIPRPHENACDVTISTVFPKRWGPIGWLERHIVRRLTDRIYSEELQLLADYVRTPR